MSREEQINQLQRKSLVSGRLRYNNEKPFEDGNIDKSLVDLKNYAELIIPIWYIADHGGIGKALMLFILRIKVSTIPKKLFII